MTISAGNIPIDLIQEGSAIRLLSHEGNLLLEDQSLEELAQVIPGNFATVKTYYTGKAEGPLSEELLNRLLLRIVLHYLDKYSKWRSLYPRERRRDLLLVGFDFENIETHDLLLFGLKELLPGAYTEPARSLLGMTREEFARFEQQRLYFQSLH